jgi:hypothetical protein
MYLDISLKEKGKGEIPTERIGKSISKRASSGGSDGKLSLENSLYSVNNLFSEGGKA